MLNNKTIQVLKRISKEAPKTRLILKNYNIKDGVLWMTDGKKAIWTPSDIKDGLYTIEGKNVTESSGTYPDIKRLIPDYYETSMKVDDVKNLLEFVKSFVKLYGLKRNNPSHNIGLSIVDNNARFARDEHTNVIQMEYNLSCNNNADLISYYNPFYLIDVLEFISANTDGNTAIIKHQGGMLPLAFETDNGAGALVMPIRKN